MKKNLLLLLIVLTTTVNAQQVDYSVVSVNEEAGLEFTQITTDNDYVCMPEVKRRGKDLQWWTNRVIDISRSSNDLGYLSFRNNTSNLFVKDLKNKVASKQRTNRQFVIDFSFSPDGTKICFTEKQGQSNRIFITDADKGFVCRQITNNELDFTPVYSHDMEQIFFARQENNKISIWGYNLKDNFVSSYTHGLNPCPLKDNKVIICSRLSNEGKYEIWKVDYSSGIEECILSDHNRSFTSPCISPNGEWILLVGSSIITTDDFSYANTDIYVCKIDGTQLTQLTYHAADDISPVWSSDGNYIYFVSQRGSSKAIANIWRIPFIIN